jgi:hypothetical protein
VKKAPTLFLGVSGDGAHGEILGKMMDLWWFDYFGSNWTWWLKYPYFGSRLYIFRDAHMGLLRDVITAIRV